MIFFRSQTLLFALDGPVLLLLAYPPPLKNKIAQISL